MVLLRAILLGEKLVIIKIRNQKIFTEDMTKKKIQYRGKIIVQWMLRKTSMILEENRDK